jgi:fructokinase
MRHSFKIVGIGEILWDVLPGGKRLGGAPANFAYAANALGDRGIILSRVGDDAPGREILSELRSKNLSTEQIQIDAENPTGRVEVELENGQPRYRIAENSAWDHMEFSERWREIALEADAICFGSLAQRSAASARTIREIVNPVKTWRIFDVNLRQIFYSPQIINKSLNTATVVKLNAEELPLIAEMLEIKKMNQIKIARDLLKKFQLKLVCVTRGAGGSVLVWKNGVAEHAGCRAEIADAIGAGDAFTAALAHGLVRSWRMEKINEYANRIGAYVASQTGATPVFPEEFKE